MTMTHCMVVHSDAVDLGLNNNLDSNLDRLGGCASSVEKDVFSLVFNLLKQSDADCRVTPLTKQKNNLTDNEKTRQKKTCQWRTEMLKQRLSREREPLVYSLGAWRLDCSAATKRRLALLTDAVGCSTAWNKQVVKQRFDMILFTVTYVTRHGYRRV